MTDDELAAIYTGAHALVFPCDDEGFGLPPVEALACGTPVVAGDCAAVREVLAGRIELRDVDDLDGLIAAAQAARRPAPRPRGGPGRTPPGRPGNVAEAIQAPASGCRWRSGRR